MILLSCLYIFFSLPSLFRTAVAQDVASQILDVASANPTLMGFVVVGTSIQTTQQYASAQFFLPAGTQELAVIGTAFPNGSQATAVCLDCVIIGSELVGGFQTFNTSSADGTVQQVSFIDLPALDPSVTHNLTIVNLDADPSRSLVLNSLAITEQTAPSSTSTATSSTATPPVPPTASATTQPAPTSTSTSAPSATGPPSAASRGITPQQRTLAIVLSTVLGSIAVFVFLFSIFCLRRRRRRHVAPPEPELGRIVEIAATARQPERETMQGPASAVTWAAAGAPAPPHTPLTREAAPRPRPLPALPASAQSQPTTGSLYSVPSAGVPPIPPAQIPRRASSRRTRHSGAPVLPMPVFASAPQLQLHLSQLPAAWQFYGDPVLPRDGASPGRMPSPSVYSLGEGEEGSGGGGGARSDVAGGFGFRWSRGTIVYPRTPSPGASAEGGAPGAWAP